MSDSPDLTNTVSGPRGRPARPGDLPEAVRRRYLSERRLDGAVVFFTDATVITPSFRDTGGRLIAARSDPATIRDLILVAQHRGWTTIQVRGADGFRREAWILGRSLGLEVQGYRATERDEQMLARRRDGQRSPRRSERDAAAGAAPTLDLRTTRDRLKVVEAVARGRTVDPAIQSRILEAARRRVAELQTRRDAERPRSQRDR